MFPNHRRGRRPRRPTAPKGRENPFPRGEGGPEGVGRGMRVETLKVVQHNRPIPGLDIVPPSRSLRFRSSNVTARIPLQSEKRSFGTAFLTASPRGKLFCASRWAVREAGPYVFYRTFPENRRGRRPRRPTAAEWRENALPDLGRAQAVAEPQASPLRGGGPA